MTDSSRPKKLNTALYALISTPIYLAIMIWGEGGWSATLAKPMVAGALLVTLLAGIVSIFSEGNISTGVKHDEADKRSLYAVIVINLLGGLLPAFFDGRSLWPIDGEPVRQAGLVIYTLGTIARLAPVFVLGKRFSGLVAIQPGHALETTGVYSVIRNPSYLGLVLMSLGWALAFNAWIGVVFTGLMVPPLIARMNAEERMLASEFGEAFQAWKARTWRLVPWIY